MVRILLTSDIHLGIDSEKTLIPEQARISTFKKICMQAKEHDLLLIAGDLFNSNEIPQEIAEIVSREFGILAENNTKIVFTPGERELDESGKISPGLKNLNISHVFSGAEDDRVYAFERNNQNIYIYGIPAINEGNFSGIKKESQNGFHIGLFHTEFSLENLSNDSKVCILQKNDIKSMNLDFYALGHLHLFKLFKFQNRIIGAYPGSPEATAFGEEGDRYILSLAVENNEIYQIKRLTVNSLRLKEINFDCAKLQSISPISQYISENKSVKTILSINLTGERKFHLDMNELLNLSNEYYRLRLIDESVPSIDFLIEEFRKENTIRGEFFTLLKKRIETNNMPAGIDLKGLAHILYGITQKGYYAPEEWLCK